MAEPAAGSGARPVRRTDEGLDYVLDTAGRPVGRPQPGWTPRRPPQPTRLDGRYCRLEAWDASRHAEALHVALHAGTAEQVAARWTYLLTEPFDDAAGLVCWLDALAATPGAWPVVVVVTDGGPDRVEGTACYLRTDSGNGVVEVGSIVFSPALARSRAATEAMVLMARHAVTDLGYRRYEWKCDALNAPSRAAARRLGFGFEGIFRNAVVLKGRNRDTAWYALTDDDFEVLAPVHAAWLDPANFDAQGRQRSSLSAATAAALPG